MSSIIVSKEDSIKYQFYQSTNQAEIFILNDGLKQTIRFLDYKALDQMIDTLHSLRRMKNTAPVRRASGIERTGRR